MGFQTYIFRSKVPSKCRKCHFRDPNYKIGFQTYIFCSKVPSKCRKCRFRDPNFKKVPGGHDPGPLQLCRHYGLPLNKILATPLGGGYQQLMFAKFKENFRTLLLLRSYVPIIHGASWKVWTSSLVCIQSTRWAFAEQQNTKHVAEIQLMRILCFKRLILGFEKRQNEIQNEVAKAKSFELSYFLVII